MRTEVQVMKRICRIGPLLGVVTTAFATIIPSGTYYRDVLPILGRHCQSCHRPGQVAPISLLSYKETRPWAEAIKYVLLAKQMPPWFRERQYLPTTGHDQLTLSEIDTIVRWVDEGAPEGDPKDSPPPAYPQQGLARSGPRPLGMRANSGN
jgi:hypothetical protein